MRFLERMIPERADEEQPAADEVGVVAHDVCPFCFWSLGGGANGECLFEELRDQYDDARGHLDPDHAVEDWDGSRLKEIAEGALGNDVGQEGGTDEHTRDPETGEGTRSDGLGPLEGPHRPGFLEHAVGAGHVQQMHGSAQDHPALEASPWCQVAVGDHVEPDDDGDRQEEEPAEDGGVEPAFQR